MSTRQLADRSAAGASRRCAAASPEAESRPAATRPGELLATGLAEQLRRAGLKGTTPRLLVLLALHESATRHLTAEDVFTNLAARRAGIGLATVYRVLSQLEDAGLLLRNLFDSHKAVYETSDGALHDHLVCLGCGEVTEFHDAAMALRQRAVASSHGYRWADRQLAIYGHCARCAGPQQER